MRTTCFITTGVLWALLIGAGSARAVDEYEQAPIRYSQSTPDNRVTKLQAQLASGERAMKYDARLGYLPELLAALEIKPESQTLVFSKTSKQRNRIAPQTPRAIYFNDDTYVGFCQQGEVLEISTADPQLGAVFYTIDADESALPQIMRDNDGCLLCHASSQVDSTPGHLVRSLFVDRAGFPIFSKGSRRVDHTTPIAERWGGWYVTGRHGAQTHQGNLIVKDLSAPRPYTNEAGLNVTDLRPFLNVEPYLTPHSDLVALMVLEHQVQVHNLLTQANYAARQARHYQLEFNRAVGEPEDRPLDSVTSRIRSAGDKLVAGLLMSEEAKLSEPLSGTTRFAAEFAAAGPRDRQGRSLRDLDMRTRMFQHPCSYLIYSPSFTGLPLEMRSYVANKLHSVLTGKDTDDAYEHLSPEDRREVYEILRDTLPELWKLVKQ